MLSCISIGIRSYYKESKLETIPCAADDAERVFHSFQKIMGDAFDDYTSVCLSDIKLTHFENLLQTLAVAIKARKDNDAKIVIYFSGHAIVRNGEFYLIFRDFIEGDFNGCYDIRLIKSIFSEFSNKVLLILDCCSAGKALPVATNLEQESELSVLAACGEYESARFNESGSVFTCALCDSIHEILACEECFTLSALLRHIWDRGYTDYWVNVGASHDPTIVFKTIPSYRKAFPKFAEAFVKELSRNNMFTREAMWYSLSAVPLSSIIEVCERYFDGSRPVEASWLVRRAIGSSLAIHADSRAIREVLIKLLGSGYWQEQCIALIGLRYLIKKERDFYNMVVGSVENGGISRIDAVWLANMYAADNPEYQPTVFLNSLLNNSPWGAIELYKGWHSKEAKSIWSNHEFSLQVAQEYRLTHDLETSANELWKSIYKQPKRGRFPENTKAKFLLSALFGNWRDQISTDFNMYFETHYDEEIADQLQTLCDIPSVERKMALFHYLKENEEHGKTFANSVVWGLTDSHPWVKRTAAEFFLHLSSFGDLLKNSYMEMQNDDRYPGILDFYLTCPLELRQELLNNISEKKILNCSDIKSLSLAFDLER